MKTCQLNSKFSNFNSHFPTSIAISILGSNYLTSFFLISFRAFQLKLKAFQLLNFSKCPFQLHISPHHLVKHNFDKFIIIELILKKFIENEIKWQLYDRRQNKKQDAFGDVLSADVTPNILSNNPMTFIKLKWDLYLTKNHYIDRLYQRSLNLT